MSSYFSRLIQQTEIAIGTGETNSRTFQPNKTNNPLRDEVTLFEPFEPREEIQAIATSQEQQFARQENFQINEVGKAEEKFSLMGKHQDAETGRAENRELSSSLHKSSSPESDRTVSLSSGDSPQSKPRENWTEPLSEPMLPAHHQGTRLNFPHEELKVGSEKILESQTEVVQPTQSSPETYLPKPPADSEEQHTPGESKRVKTTPQVKAIPPESNPLPTHQVTLKTIREWVAGTKNAQFNTEPLPISETEPQEFSNSVAEIKNSSLNPQLSQFSDSQPQPKPNFMLSIGTISLTVEAPQTEVKQLPLPPIKSPQKVKPVSSISRLNRHYLRL